MITTLSLYSESFYDNLGEPKSIFKSLAVQNNIGLIAIDEAHLI